MKAKIILPILILGLGLRLINIDQSLWLDESINVLAAKDLGFWHFVSGYPIGDFHPPGYFAILWVWGHLFGFSELAVRFPSIIFGVATIYLTYLIGKAFFNERASILAALLLAINPLHIYYSQEARMYSMSAFCAVLTIFFLSKFLEKGKRFLFPLIFSIALLLYSDYLVYLLLPSLFIFVFWVERRKLLKVSLAMGGGFLFLLPWLTVFPQQLASGRSTAENVPGWAKIVGGSSIKNFLLVYVKSVIGRVSFDDKFLYGSILSVLGIIYSYLTIKVLKKFDKQSKLLFCWVFLPTLIALVISFYIPVLNYFRMLYIVPGFCLLVASGLLLLEKKYLQIAVIFLVSINVIFTGIYMFNPKFQRENWKGLVKYLKTVDAQSSTVLFENNNLPAPYRYYDNGQISSFGALANFPAIDTNDIVDVDTLTNGKSHIYLVNYLVEISDPNRMVDKKLVESRWEVKNVYDIPSLGLIYEYSKP